MERQANFSNQAKALGVKKTCIYYTTRELSNRCYEMPTLRNLASPTDHFFGMKQFTDAMPCLCSVHQLVCFVYF